MTLGLDHVVSVVARIINTLLNGELEKCVHFNLMFNFMFFSKPFPINSFSNAQLVFLKAISQYLGWQSVSGCVLFNPQPHHWYTDSMDSFASTEGS